MNKSKYQKVKALSEKKNSKLTTSVWQLEVLEPRLLLSADAMPGIHELEGTIEQPGEQDVYEFVLDKQSRFLFDGVQGAQINWRLDGPAGADKFA